MGSWGVDHARNTGAAFAFVECVYFRSNLEIADCEAFALTQIFRPRFDQEGFDIAGWIGGILEQAPTHGAVAKPNRFQLVNRGHELIGLRWIDAIANGDEHRAVFWLQFDDDGWIRARQTVRGSQIECAGGDAEAAPKGQSSEQANCRDGKRCGCAP